MNAYEELIAELGDDETVEGIVFGTFLHADFTNRDNKDVPPLQRPGLREPDPPPVPFEKRAIVLSLSEAEPYMQNWRFSTTRLMLAGDLPSSYAVYIWTNQRILWVNSYESSNGLMSAPRHPVATIPEFSGGG